MVNRCTPCSGVLNWYIVSSLGRESLMHLILCTLILPQKYGLVRYRTHLSKITVMPHSSALYEHTIQIYRNYESTVIFESINIWKSFRLYKSFVTVPATILFFSLIVLVLCSIYFNYLIDDIKYFIYSKNKKHKT